MPKASGVRGESVKLARLERYQVLVYLAAVVCGLALGLYADPVTAVLDGLLWPLLALLLYATFLQVPLLRWRGALSGGRFLAAAVVGNFLLLPFAVWLLVMLAPDSPGVRLGLLLVLLVPCTDWFISFAHLGGGDARAATVFAPLSLLLQVLALPLYLWLFFGEQFLLTLATGELLRAFMILVLLPLLAAAVTQKVARRHARMAALKERLAWWPVPLLALVILAVAATQVDVVSGSLSLLAAVLPVFLAFLAIAAVLARVLARALRLSTRQGRTLAFSFGTRNSFVVLPVALALPASLELAAVVVVLQSLVELAAMSVWVRWVPARLFASPQPPARP